MKAIALLLGVLLLASCTGSIAGTLREGGAADLRLTVSVTPRVSSLIRSLSAVLGQPAVSGPILDGAAISAALAASPGVSSARLINTGPASLEGSAAVTRVDQVLPAAGNNGSRDGNNGSAIGNDGSAFIVWKDGGVPGAAGSGSGVSGYGSVRVTLNRETVPGLVSLLSAEAVEYLTALMAPVILGEYMTGPDYLSLVASLYGKPIADEIRNAAINASITVPGRVTNASGPGAAWTAGSGTGGTTAQFTIPLLDILLLETPLVWEIAWN